MLTGKLRDRALSTLSATLPKEQPEFLKAKPVGHIMVCF
jgi:hypothetical protein